MKCTECGLREATQGEFCDLCFNETKVCRRCQQTLTIFKFQKNQKSIAGKISRRGECFDCRKWKKSIPMKMRSEYNKIRPMPPLGKPFSCPVCKNTFMRQFKNDVVLEHDHKTGEIRGWLCRMCNNGMGMMDDNVDILQRAIKWIKGTL